MCTGSDKKCKLYLAHILPERMIQREQIQIFPFLFPKVLNKVYTDYVQSMYRIYTEYIHNIYRIYTGYIQSIYRVYTECTQRTESRNRRIITIHHLVRNTTSHTRF